MSLDTFLLWVVVGLIAGWLASALVGGGYGVIGDIVVGVVGSFVGAMKVLADCAVAADGVVTIGATTLSLPAQAGRTQATLGLRPEDLEVGDTARAGAFNVDATIV